MAGNYLLFKASRVAPVVKNLPANAGRSETMPKIAWRAWQFTPVFLSGEAHGQRSLVGYNLWGRKESDTTGAT